MREASAICALKGRFQVENIRLVLEAIRFLRGRGWRIPAAAVRKGLRKVRWSGRFQWESVRIGKRRLPLLLDGAHNPDAVRKLLDSLRWEGWQRRGCILVFNALKDKNVGKMLKLILKDLKVRLMLVPALGTERTTAPQAVLRRAKALAKGLRLRTFASVWSLWKRAEVPGDARWMVATGSLYLVGETLASLKGRNRS
jgi:dihydrofolate synthase/folylpolyglutamate synthase